MISASQSTVILEIFFKGQLSSILKSQIHIRSLKSSTEAIDGCLTTLLGVLAADKEQLKISARLYVTDNLRSFPQLQPTSFAMQLPLPQI